MNIAIITAGGSGKRMKTNDIPKQFLLVCNKPIVIYTLEHFEKCEDIDAVVISCIEEWIPHMKKIVEEFRITKVLRIVKGGETGQESIRNGLNAVHDLCSDDESIILVHDGVRPLISSKLISENINTVKKYGSCVTTAPVNETVVCVNEGQISNVLNRSNLRLARAPQSFYLNDMLSAHQRAEKENIHSFVDSCQLMSFYGTQLHYLEGPHDNIKITTVEDYYILRTMIQRREDDQFQ